MADPTVDPPADADPPVPTPEAPLWRNERQRVDRGRRRSIVVALGLITITVAGLIYLLSWLDPIARPVLVLIEGVPIGTTIPGGTGDRRALLDLNTFTTITARVGSSAGPVTLVGEFERRQAELQGKTVVIYLLASAWVDRAHDTPNLRIAGRSRATAGKDAPDGVPLASILAAIHAEGPTRPASLTGRALRPAHLLLILDLHPLAPSPRDPVAGEDLGQVIALEAAQSMSTYPDLTILSSCGAGQTPGSSPALGRTAFGYYVEQGLRGWADTAADRRLTAAELSLYVRDRVERWSRRCRARAQTPGLHRNPETADFPIVTVPTAVSVAPVLPKEAPGYPAWLLDAWRMRDLGLRSGEDRTAPRPFGHLEAALLQAERDWIGGSAEAEVRKLWRDQIPRLRDRIATAQAITPLPPRSLAMARAWGAADDPDLTRALREWLGKRPRPTPDAKPAETRVNDARSIAEFLGPMAGKSDFALASAVVQVATERADLTPDLVIVLDQLLATRQPQPISTETAALRRIAQQPTSGWRADRARVALNLTLRTAAAQSNPVALSASRSALDAADRLRHEAETLAALPGYSDPTDADRLLVAALGAADSCLSRIEQVSQVRRLREEAPRVLLAALPLLAGDDDLSRVWLTAANQLQALRVDDRAGRGTEPGEVQTDRLEAGLKRLREPAVHARVTRLTGPDAGLEAEDYATIATLMATTLPSADDRADLWKARIALDRILTGAVLALDKQDGRKLTAPPSRREMQPGITELTAEPLTRSQRELLGVVAGLNQPALDREAATADDPSTDPTRLQRAAEWSQLGQWLLARYEFEAVDPEPSEFFAAAARDYALYRTTAPQRLTIAADATTQRLTPTQPSAVATVRLGLAGAGTPARGGTESAWVDWISANRSVLDVRPTTVQTRDGAGWPVQVPADRGEVAVSLRLRPEPGTRVQLPPGPSPRGVLVRARWAGRTYHFPLPLEIETAANRLQPSLTAANSPPDQPLGAIDLRPAQGKAPFSLRVKNPSDHDRAVVTQLFDRQGPIAGATVTQTIRAGEQARIGFGPAPPDLETAMVEIQGPLTIQVADAAYPAEAVTLEIPVQLVPPSDLVRIVAASYDPGSGRSGGKSRLEIRLRAAGGVAGPAPLLEMRLPPERTPGLIFAGEGTFRGTMPKPGEELILFAEGLQFDPRGSEAGVVTLNVDGVERALILETRFPRRGPAVPLILDPQPALRLRGERVAAAGSLWPLTIEVDSPPPAGRIVLTLGQYAAGGLGDRFDVAQQFDLNAQRARFRLNPRGPDGTLILDASVRDPAVTLDLAGIRGGRLVLAKLVNDQGQTVAEDQLDLIIDDRAPAEARFVDPPRYGLKGGSIGLRVAGSVPASGLKEVAFFVGRPGPDNKRPANVAITPGQPTDSGRTTWGAAVALADAKLGPLDLTAEFVAGNGLSRFVTTSITVVDSIPIEPGEVQGVVREGNRPQPGFDVQVLDEKGAEQRKVQTNAEGQFVVRGLPPGKYQVVSTKLTPPTRGTTTAVVQPNRITAVEVRMFRGP